MKKSYQPTLPEGYRVVYTIDANEKRFGIVFNLITFSIIALFALGGYLCLRPLDFLQGGVGYSLMFCVCLLCYIVLHEAVHGVAFWVCTGQRPTFGLTWSAAYCGVPGIYVYRRTALIATLAPFLFFLPVLVCATLLLPAPLGRFYATVLLGLHVGGCSGDLYGAYLLLFRFRRPDTLMRDTGPRQQYYLPDFSKTT